MQFSPSSASLDQAESTRVRLAVLALLVLIVFVLLVGRLWFLQVMAGARYAVAAEGNAVRTISVEAPRGRLLDRHGDPIVRNRYAQVVSVQPAEIPRGRVDQVLADLADLLGMEPGELKQRMESSRVGPFRPKPVAVDVPRDIVFYIHENASTRFPGVYAERLPLREYLYGSLAAHVVGHLGEISAEQLREPEYSGYEQGDVIGWEGVERTYEPVLRGADGHRQLLVNSKGEILEETSTKAPQPGADLLLTIDVEAQQKAEDALAKGIEVARTLPDAHAGGGRAASFQAPAGAAIVLDPRTGEVVAMASFPSYEPSKFVGGVSQEYWSWLQSEDSAYPLINRAIAASYPPGSVFKVVSASAALEYGFAGMRSLLPCPGAYEWNGFVFRNWRRSDSGAMTLATALEQSCDTVFYRLARSMWEREQATPEGQPILEHLSEQSRRWGLGKPTGIDLPGERVGVVPGRQWKRDFWEDAKDGYCARALQPGLSERAHRLFTELCDPSAARWRGGDAVNMSIGQGDVQTTPIQVANLFAGIANDGKVMRPHVVREISHPDGRQERVEPEQLAELPVGPDVLDYIGAGLAGVTQPGGTAGAAFAGFPVPIAGKTGTAEFGKSKQPFAWFAAYNPEPVEGQQYVVVVTVEEGGGGSQTAAPIARRILEGLFGLDATALHAGVATD
ncbi:MAG: penicillin-binding protein 2 [Egibacteraceae bacterium]